MEGLKILSESTTSVSNDISEIFFYSWAILMTASLVLAFTSYEKIAKIMSGILCIIFIYFHLPINLSKLKNIR